MELHGEFQASLGYGSVSVKTEKIKNTDQEKRSLIRAKHCVPDCMRKEFSHAVLFKPPSEISNVIARFLQTRKPVEPTAPLLMAQIQKALDGRDKCHRTMVPLRPALTDRL